MSSNGAQNAKTITFFGYDLSPYARRVVFYLQLRGLPYSHCAQAPILPRPDLTNLGVQYRRIPVLAIGKDIYTDSALIIQALDAAFPGSHLALPPGPEAAALSTLLSRWTIDGGLFMRAVQCLPLNLGIWTDAKFVKDREQFAGPGSDWSLAAFEKTRPEALREMRNAIAWLEEGLLSDGRKWILGTSGITMGDLEGAWLFHWLWSIPGSFEPSGITKEAFPRVFAWLERFDAELKAGAEKLGPPQKVSGEEAFKNITSADYVDKNEVVDPKDEVGLKKGQNVNFFPLDSGTENKQPGKLVRLDRDEVAVEVETVGGGGNVRIHAPRHNFRVEAAA